jgi:hypothetical protein
LFCETLLSSSEQVLSHVCIRSNSRRGLLGFDFTLKTKAAKCSEELLSYIITRCHNPEDRDFNLHRRENLKSRILSIVLTGMIILSLSCKVEKYI